MRANKRGYYEVLGVSQGASEDEIRRAFRKLARECHPDVSRDPGCEERFKEVNEAYEVLSDPTKRRAYDRGQLGGPGIGDFQRYGFEDIFDAFFNGMGTTTSTRRRARRGSDLRYALTLSLEEAAFGCENEIEIARWEHCSACGGSGAEPGVEPVTCPQCGGRGEVRQVQDSIFGRFTSVAICPRCRGEGTVVTLPCKRCRAEGLEKRTRKIKVKVPAGVDDGTQVRFPGDGEVGERGGVPGDLFVHITLKEHPIFKRQGNDIVMDLPINIAQAALGDEIEVPTIDGTGAKIRVQPGTQSGKVYRIRDKGIPYLGTNGRGDQQVRVKVTTPTQLTDEQKELLVTLARSFGTEIHPQDDKGFFNKFKDVFRSE